ncbi:MAG: PSD1 domain-containing protein [Verrucomicrobiales bacterium]|nr:PSD1 domain-containing protein [Verrucomicrobiales bacterium]MCP5560840.1 PSD1 domain-containing protein [Verrucomicrobiaceae bacterium]
MKPSSTILFLLLLLPARAPAAAAIDYNRDIRPILSENCFACHGFDEKARKAKLRLDVQGSAYEERDGITPIKPGDLKNSEVWMRIITDDEDEVMPPPKSHLSFTAADKEKIKGWIEQGAKYAGHWSFIAPQRPPVPAGTPSAIDALVRQRLADEGMTPSAPADPAMLIRRVALDLTGLPPSAEEVEAFVNDQTPQAYETLVDRLLKSPHFGERLALEWLDAARYADTNGFSIDGGRHMWLWRDWVIQAFNDNKPYDRFLIEQLAGDLLPNHTEADLIATGFQRNNMVTHEGGTIPEENLTNYNVDRVKTLGESVLGLTLGCAQCHNHKFDPITQQDYYSMYAFFNSLSDKGLDGNAGVNPGPFITAKTVLKTDEIPVLQNQITILKQRLAQPDPKILAAWETRQQATLANRGKDLKIHPIKVLKISTPNRGAGFDIEGENAVRLNGVGDLGAFDISTQLPKTNAPITGLRVVIHPVAELPGGGWGSGPVAKRARGKAAAEPPAKGTFVLTAIDVTADTVANDQVNLHKLEPISHTTASSWDPKFPPADCLDPRNENGWSPDLVAEGAVHLTATFEKPLDAAQTPFLTTQLNFGHGQSLVAQHIEFFVITGTDEDSDLPSSIISILKTPADKRDAAQQSALWTECANQSKELQRTRIDLENLEDRVIALTEPFPTMVMDMAAKPRDTFILNRGDYAQPTTKVSTGTIAALPPMPDGASADRLGLAQWITMKSNPLTARVAVNRFWKMLFGIGIVATPADFGAQGEWPSHPDVLDWLAVDFMESGWNVKHLIKNIVMSETYRQTSAATQAMLDRDPQNRLLARGPRFRLAAELLRDAALKTSGLLVQRIGGPSVNPYTPGDLWREVSHYGSTPATAQTFVQDHGEKLYRRSLYTFWKRTAAPPNMTAFDAPNREVCTISRGDTTTPLQALVTLNDPQFVEASRAFAERILHHNGDDQARLKWAFLEALSRPPSPEELSILTTTLTRERQRYSTDESAARKILSVGESPHDPKLSPTEHAAWMQAATLILNLSEAVTRN